jgi:hypothetical protein
MTERGRVERQVMNLSPQLESASACAGAEKEAEAVTRARSKFPPAMSNELRTLMNGIPDYVPLMLRDTALTRLLKETCR